MPKNTNQLIIQARALLAMALPSDKVILRPDSFGKLIKQRREEAGLSLQLLADAIGCTKSYLWANEQGRCNPSTKVVWEIAGALSIDPAFALELSAASYSRKGAFNASKEG